jgi:phospholipid N-methyltransferase
MSLLPPGTILQHMYLGERLKRLASGEFVEVGPGAGDLTDLLLSEGWVGTCFDLNEQTIAKLANRFSKEIKAGKLRLRNEDFTSSSIEASVDLVISCMVMEHLSNADEQSFLSSAKMRLKTDGKMIAFVPSSPENWGIEDDIAGHFRRYTRESVSNLLQKTDWKLEHISGLTFPVSNMLLPISNYLVRKSEAEKIELSLKERTKLSGNRNVFFKTSFPAIAKLLLNRLVMSPFHWLQKKLGNSESALVLYFEAAPLVGGSNRGD